MVSIIAVLVLGVAVSVVVGRALRRAGRPFLDDVLQDDRVADAVSRLLDVLFYLVSLGTVALVASVDLPGVALLYAVSLKVGVVLVVLGGAHGATVLVLLRIKKRRRHQLVEEEMARRLGRAGTELT
jgi:hypothetical protein